MITMLWKELRENAKWGALALLGLLMAEFYAINQQQFFGFYVQESAPLCKSSFLMITTFGCAAVGLVIGLVQMLPEQRRDQWAALIHRPVERATIFRGKAVAGLIIYLIATIVPFFACVWYASKPGHFAAPFTPRMIFPGVADICAGSMYYFAALFVSLQRGAWWSTRAFGVLAALSGSFIVTSSYLHFYVVIEDAVVMSLALFTAAWAAMLTNGTFMGRPWIGKFATLAVVFFGVGAAIQIFFMIWAAFEKPNYYFGQEYVLDLDGRPLLEKYKPDGSRTFKDLDGRDVNDPRLTGGQGYQNVIQFADISAFVGNSHGLPLTHEAGYGGYRGSETYATLIYAYDQVTNEAWFYLPAERVFKGYNSLNRAPIGAIGQDGFVPGTAAAMPFIKRLGSTRNFQITPTVRFGRTVYYMDFSDRAAKPILTAVGISGAQSVNSSTDNDKLPGLAGVATPEHLVLVDKNAKIFATLPYDRDMDQWGDLSVGVKSAEGPIFLKYQPSDWIPYPKARSMPSYLEVFNPQGQLQKTYTLPPLEQPSYPRAWRTWLTEGLQEPAYFYGRMIYEKIGAMLGSHRLAGQLHAQFNDGWGYTKDIGTRITILSFLLAAVALVWARRSQFSWSEAWKWAAFTFLFNLAGLITFRLAADWPVRIKCPACGKPRRVDHDTCPSCAAAWAVPQRDGTEIVDDAATPAEV